MTDSSASEFARCRTEIRALVVAHGHQLLGLLNLLVSKAEVDPGRGLTLGSKLARPPRRGLGLRDEIGGWTQTATNVDQETPDEMPSSETTASGTTKSPGPPSWLCEHANSICVVLKGSRPSRKEVLTSEHLLITHPRKSFCQFEPASAKSSLSQFRLLTPLAHRVFCQALLGACSGCIYHGQRPPLILSTSYNIC